MGGSINFGAIDPLSPVKGAAAANALLRGIAQVRAGRALSAGDQTGAVKTLQNAGDLSGAHEVKQRMWDEDDRVTKMDATKRKESAEFTIEATSALYSHLQKAKQENPEGAIQDTLTAFEQLAPILKSRGASDDDIVMFRTQLSQDPERFLTMLHDEASSHLKTHVLSPGQELTRADGEVLHSVAPKKEFKILRAGDGSQKLIEVGGPEDIAGADTVMASEEVQTQAPGPTNSAADFDVLGDLIEAGAKITSGMRTPEDNVRVGGVTNSLHMQDKARDLVPPEGMTMAQLAEQVRQRMPHADVIDEGDHVHVELDGKPRGGMNVMAGGSGQDTVRPATGARVVAETAAKPVANWVTVTAGPNDPNFRPGTTYQRNPVTGEVKVKQAPPTAAKTATSGGAVKIPASQEAELAKLRKSVNEVQGMSGLVDQFVALNKSVNTGGSMALPGVGEVLGAVNPNVARMRSIASQITPAMRNGLPGAASDKDVAMFKSATVGIDKPYAANVATAKAAKAFAARQGDYVSFLEAYARENGTINGSSELWKNYVDANPLFSEGGADGMLAIRKIVPWRQAIKMGGAKPAASGEPKVRRYNRETGTFE